MRANIYLYLAAILAIFSVKAQAQAQEDIRHALSNPVSESFLEQNLAKTHPYLIYNQQIVDDLKIKIDTDPLISNMYRVVKHKADEIHEKPLLERILTGRRLLSVSREMLYRINMLGVVYLVENNPLILERINRELLAVCSFTDWNPSHFLDVAEMSLAVALAIDWTGDNLPEETVIAAKSALIEKGIQAGWPKGDNPQPWWVNTNNNWNQVCHGGMIAASLVIAKQNPELAVKTIKRALEKIPIALAEYMPDGVYPEGASYWTYGTSYSVMTSEMLNTALGTDFGIKDFPGFKEGAMFKTMCHAPSGQYYNFFDCSDNWPTGGDIVLAWFGAETGESIFFEKDRFMKSSELTPLDRLTGSSLAWLSRYENSSNEITPEVWFGNGKNPVAIFKDKAGNGDYYFGAKGGCGALNHGNMDAGSFVFETGGNRWVIDPGVQGYNELEQEGFDLWGSCQSCDRWKLLTKNNFGHSTLTINGELHKANGLARMTGSKSGEQPEVSFDLSAAFSGLADSVYRKFTRDGKESLLIEDYIKINENTQSVTWQLITTAEVDISNSGATLRQDGKELIISNLSHQGLSFQIVSLDPPPFKFDRVIKNLKRLELSIPVEEIKLKNNELNIRITLKEK